MEINVTKRGKEWNVIFNHKHQYFTLDYHAETKEEAEWMKDILAKCFKNAFGEPPLKESVLPISGVSVSVCVNCDQERETHAICSECLAKIINENKQTEEADYWSERCKLVESIWENSNVEYIDKVLSDLETEFKALMHCGMYVDANLLQKGIYTCEKPFIYSKDETIENMVERGKQMKDMTGASFIGDKYFENLQQCELVKMFVTVAYK